MANLSSDPENEGGTVRKPRRSAFKRRRDQLLRRPPSRITAHSKEYHETELHNQRWPTSRNTRATQKTRAATFENRDAQLSHDAGISSRGDPHLELQLIQNSIINQSYTNNVGQPLETLERPRERGWLSLRTDTLSFQTTAGSALEAMTILQFGSSMGAGAP